MFRSITTTAVVLLVLAPASGGRATTHHTITVDGVLTDFTADEKTAGDPATDSDYGADNELAALHVTWDANALYLGFDYTAWGAGVLYLIDTGKAGGVTDLCPNRGYTGAFPANLQASASLDLLVALYAKADTSTKTIAAAHTLAANTSVDISQKSGVTIQHKETAAATQRIGVVELAIPWDQLYGLGAGKVPAGATLKIAGALRGKNDGDGLGDLSPGAKGLPKSGNCWSSDTNALTAFHTITVDANSDGAPDTGWSPGSNTSKVDAGVPPADAAPTLDTSAPDAATADATTVDAAPSTDSQTAADASGPATDAVATNDGPSKDITYVDAAVEGERQEEGCACSAKADAQAMALPLLFLVGFVLIQRRR
jgi:MYXO-CTERM domain-containing protein